MKKTYTKELSNGAELVIIVDRETVSTEYIDFDSGMTMNRGKSEIMDRSVIQIIKDGKKLFENSLLAYYRKFVSVHNGEKCIFIGMNKITFTDTEVYNWLETVHAEIFEEFTKKNAEELVKKAEVLVKKAEAQKAILTRDEIKEKESWYNRVMNEGGSGYVPDYGVSSEDYEAAIKLLKEKKGDC